jgi:hypothetical protein
MVPLTQKGISGTKRRGSAGDLAVVGDGKWAAGGQRGFSSILRTEGLTRDFRWHRMPG